MRRREGVLDFSIHQYKNVVKKRVYSYSITTLSKPYPYLFTNIKT